MSSIYIASFSVYGSPNAKVPKIERRITNRVNGILLTEYNPHSNEIIVRYSANKDVNVLESATQEIHRFGLIVENSIDYNDEAPKDIEQQIKSL